MGKKGEKNGKEEKVSTASALKRYDHDFAAGRSPAFLSLRAARFEQLANGGGGGELAFAEL